MNVKGIIATLVMLIIFCYGFYKYSLNEDGGKFIKLSVIKRVFAILIILGFASLYSQTKDNEFKGLWLVCIILLINVYTVVYSTGKCNYPNLYKIKLVLWTSLVIIMMVIPGWYGTFGTVFGFELSDEVKEVVDTVESDKITGTVAFSGKMDCPDPSNSKIYNKKMNALKKNDPEKARKCLSYYQMQETDKDKGIYG